MEEAVVEEAETYITRRQNTSAQFIATMPIMDLCMAKVRHPGARFFEAVVVTGGNQYGGDIGCGVGGGGGELLEGSGGRGDGGRDRNLSKRIPYQLIP